MKTMKGIIENLENKILSDIKAYDRYDGYLKEITFKTIDRDYTQLHSYHRNLPDIRSDNYEVITDWVREHSAYWNNRRDE